MRRYLLNKIFGTFFINIISYLVRVYDNNKTMLKLIYIYIYIYFIILNFIFFLNCDDKILYNIFEAYKFVDHIFGRSKLAGLDNGTIGLSYLEWVIG